MFSWSKKKERRERPERSSEENEFGIKLDKGPSDKQLEAELKALAGVDELPEDDLHLNEGEDDVESELLRLIGGGGKGKRLPKKAAATPNEALEDLGDISADIQDVGDEDVEIDENDEELLGELLELTQPEEAIEEEAESEPEAEDAPSGGETDVLSVLKERLKMYKAAEAKAKETGESSRARRFNRGIKTLEDLVKKAKAGKVVAPGDIPPVIAMNLKPPPPVQPEAATEGEDSRGEVEESEETQPSPETPEGPVDVLSTLTERLKLYQTAEAKAKESGETMRAKRFNRGIKTIEGLIRQAKAGKPVSPADIPPLVALNLKPAPPPPPPQPEEPTLEEPTPEEEEETGNLDPSQESKEEEPERSINDVLSERLGMYRTAEEKAKEKGEGTRARRFGRGIKTIEDLMRQAQAGKPVALDDIPPPIALNLQPAPPVVQQSEDQPVDAPVETENLVRSPPGVPLTFSAVDDVDLELLEEETPMTVVDGLEQRIRMYTRLKEKAEEEGDEVAAEQNEKFIRLYLNAIRTFKNGGHVDVERLPAPKGAPPIPIPFHIP